MKTIFTTLLALIFITGHTQEQVSIKLFRYGSIGSEKPAVVTSDGKRLDVSAYCEDFNERFFRDGGIEKLDNWLKQNAGNCPAVPDNVRLGSCVARPSKIIGIGLNYVNHVRESGAVMPTEPIVFMKASTSLSGPNDEVLMPPNSVKTDYEAELAIIIGKEAVRVSEADASKYIAGYAIINDYSEREWQLENSARQWDKGKSPDTFAPLGPYLVHTSAVGDPANLKIWLKVNGDVKQDANTQELIFKPETLVSYLSQFMTLLPGDVIATGTPSGVGMGVKPPQFLKIGDEVELGIEKLGMQKQKINSAIKYFLTDAEYRDFQDWVAIGVGGLPHTLDGYRLVKKLGGQMHAPLDVGVFSSLIGKGKDVRTLGSLPKRKGTKPAIAPFAIPHRQVDQNNSNEVRTKENSLFDQIVSANSKLVHFDKSYYEKNNRSIYLVDTNSGNPDVIAITHAEIAHMHPSDGSIHATLSPSDAKQVIEKGWGELHGLSGQVIKGDDRLPSTYTMIYAPRTDAELEVVKKIIEGAIKYSSNR